MYLFTGGIPRLPHRLHNYISICRRHTAPSTQTSQLCIYLQEAYRAFHTDFTTVYLSVGGIPRLPHRLHNCVSICRRHTAPSTQTSQLCIYLQEAYRAFHTDFTTVYLSVGGIPRLPHRLHNCVSIYRRHTAPSTQTSQLCIYL